MPRDSSEFTLETMLLDLTTAEDDHADNDYDDDDDDGSELWCGDRLTEVFCISAEVTGQG